MRIKTYSNSQLLRQLKWYEQATQSLGVELYKKQEEIDRLNRVLKQYIEVTNGQPSNDTEDGGDRQAQ